MTGGAGLLQLRLASVAEAARDIRLFEFVSADGAPLPAFEPGAHLSLHLPSGLERQYSLCNDPAESDRYVVAVKREAGGRGGSQEMHALEPSAIISTRPPANHFPLAPAPAVPLLIAGGIGITPIIAMMRHLRTKGRPFHLVYLARSKSDAAFLNLLAEPGPNGRVTLHFDDTAAGFFDIAGCLAAAEPSEQVHCCGPTPLMEAVRTEATKLGWAPERLHFEFFVNDQPKAEAGDRPFEAVLARSRRSVQVRADQTLLDALLEAGLDVDYSCSEGTCGTCITRVLEGEIDHRDVVLTPGERAKNIALCCSRAAGTKLTLDL